MRLDEPISASIRPFAAAVLFLMIAAFSPAQGQEERVEANFAELRTTNTKKHDKKDTQADVALIVTSPSAFVIAGIPLAAQSKEKNALPSLITDLHGALH